ncbi:MAG TPA: autotransporter outer membrane beta-barrel domain-containing protein [Alphaproteobacteria bacterium]|nr:autotransporter outer membrane beta-barrel domain-containing protein [Alphaproteobacteria bacterium]
MRTLKIALLATAAVAALSSATMAADLVIEPEPVIDNSFGGFDWEGPYAGLWVGGLTNPAVFALGADLGVNALIDSSLLAGVEGNISWESNSTWSVQGHGRLGFLADPALIYGLAGVGWNSGSGAYIPLGVGAEFAVADNLSLKAEYNYQWGPNRHVGKVGFNFHF